MGISIGVSKSSYPEKEHKSLFSKWDDKPAEASGDSPVPQSPNPDPERWHIMEARQIGHALVVKLYYPGCTNYEGNKIMVYENCTIQQLKEQKRIDPHFSENRKFHSPVGRFEPTSRGWQYACAMAHMLNVIQPISISSGKFNPHGPIK